MSDSNIDSDIDLDATVGDHFMDLSPELRRIRLEGLAICDDLDQFSDKTTAAREVTRAEIEAMREQIDVMEAAEDARKAAEAAYKEATKEYEAAEARHQKASAEVEKLLGEWEKQILDRDMKANELLEAFARFEDAHRPERGAKPVYPPRGNMVAWGVRIDEVLLAEIEAFVEEHGESRAAFIRRAVTRELMRGD